MPPNGLPVLSTTLPTLRLDLLQSGDAAESRRLLDACRTHGFFYLDLSSHTDLCLQWEDMLAAMKNYFEQPLEVKMQDARGSDNYGYEPQGTEVGPKPMTVDGYESLKISRREFLKGETDLTTSIQGHKKFFFNFMRNAHDVTMIMLERLSNELGLSSAARFETFHADPGPSLSNLTLLRYPKQEGSEPRNLGHNKHTDIGSLTFLLAQQWGLQVLSPDHETWAFVKPRPKHAVINVGDSLRFASNGQLLSAVHRVIPLHERQEEDRYSIAYFLRINDDTPFHDSSRKLWSAKEWHDFKFNVFRSPASLDPSMQILTGMMEKNDTHISYVKAMPVVD